MPHSQTIHAVRDLSPVLERLLSTTHTLFRRRLADDQEPLDVKSALPGLEVSDSTWEAWEAAATEAPFDTRESGKLAGNGAGLTGNR
jgi:hypothetical protein